MDFFRSKSTESGPKYKYVEDGKEFGNGQSKKAFHTQVAKPPFLSFLFTEYYCQIPEEKDAADFCLVKFETKHDKHFNKRRTLEFLTELEELQQLSELDLAPKLHQIRVDRKDVNGKIFENGVPFLPEALNSKKQELINLKTPDYNNYFAVSYLVEMCGEPIDAFLKKNNNESSKLAQVGEKFNDFTEKLISITNTANMDLKPANMCAKYDKKTGEIVSIGLLDVDPRFSMTSETEGFSKHAKVFMNFLFFSFCLKYNSIKFPNWYLTKDEVREMTRFFFTKEFTEKTHAPIDMLCHYLKLKRPSESAGLIVFEDSINEIPETDSGKDGKDNKTESGKEDSKDDKTDSGKEDSKEDPDSKGGKKPRKRRKSKSKKRGRKARTRKN